MNGDEQLLNGRVYGAEHDDPNPGPLPHQTYAELVGGPLDGLLLPQARHRGPSVRLVPGDGPAARCRGDRDRRGQHSG
ncbi:hypothetical protein [Streptomyces albidoflavus]|uniref:hypothetical protein n=1 Tax=Streptomyces albidoflavus TaxID=1886 RepID=UPI0038D15ECB